ncbi:MAG TPA: peptide-methionine (S)-S-oxide reductase MsrA [Tepidisphaeraceae bacterium]|nr:peptide-methionine (S)-S-oxide reductase MsrA [Tepidisphaeraceae bacterium]
MILRMLRGIIILTLCIGAFAYYEMHSARRIESDPGQPTPTKFAIASKTKPARVEIASFSGGCFWAMEALFRETPGVIATRVGFSGGHAIDPSYKQVCTGKTGHAETTEVQFDPDRVSYQHLLELFFENHDPTFNHSGGEATDQCRSIIFFHSADQQTLAEAELKKTKSSGDYPLPVLTQILPAGDFYPAESYHQQYIEKQGIHFVCPIGNGRKR